MKKTEFKVMRILRRPKRKNGNDLPFYPAHIFRKQMPLCGECESDPMAIWKGDDCLIEVAEDFPEKKMCQKCKRKLSWILTARANTINGNLGVSQ
jgi:hypothetical protein